MKTNPNDAAFSIPETENYKPIRGLTKREYFAALALTGIISNDMINFDPDAKSYRPEHGANKAVVMADALIAELNKEK